MKPIQQLILLFFLLTSAACTSTLSTYSSKTKGADLDQYSTYAWVNPSGGSEEEQQNKKQYSQFILEQADAQIRAKGFRLDTVNPEVLFHFDTQIEHRVAYRQSPSVSVGMGFGGPGYYVGGAVPVSGGQLIQDEFDEGMLVIEMIETATGKRLWRGWAKERIGFETDLEADLEKAIKQIFMRLPVKKKK
ncbi:MAG: DUF4136 domain-containing protein [Cyclobacteriaceae bacterium]|nr:DUF4136 domain-containing protein [Cyclobacteriaceae bacterium]MDX5467790.1 DUF4136 domain-containing protein [Cyclobacteriaceae bacterium]